MKKTIILLSLVLMACLVQAQTWVGYSSAQSRAGEVSLVTGTAQSSQIHVDVAGFQKQEVLTPNGTAYVITLDGSTSILEAGAPDLPKLTASLIIPDNAQMEVNVTGSTFVEYQNIEIAPSKGNFTRDIDPASVPYIYGSAYEQDAFYPGTLAALKDPYIMRDLRGQAVDFYPYQYNPVTKTLRVYTSIDVTVSQNGTGNVNVLSRNTPLTSFDPEFAEIYKTHFLNYTATNRYTALGETGKLLIICYDNFMSQMTPYVIWKKTKGIPTEIVSVTTAGSTAANIKTYVTNYYNTNGLTFLLLVGDAAQVPTFTVAGGGSDNSYGYITGSDHYQEIIVGRFSAEGTTDVATQVTRSINYEKTPSLTANKFNRTIAIGSDQGPGDDSEYDYQHQRNLQTAMTGFTYTSKVELFDGSQGGLDAAGNPTAAMLGTEINNGAGIITYTGHGSDNAFSTTGFSNTDIAGLTNTNILPFIWSVACVNGNFTAGTCFAEGWLRKQYNGQPAGAVAALMSTINQSWNPPMEGQDEMVDILVESYVNNIKRTFGGLSVNGIFKMNDTYADYNMTDTWTIFGDPSLMVRTDNPASMTVTHNPTINIGETSLSVNCNVDGALVCLTIDHEIIGTAYASGGTALITFPALATVDTITVCATAFNYVPYLGEVLIVSANYPNDAMMASIITPEPSYGCEGLSVAPLVTLRNMGTNTLTSCVITYTIDGGAPATYNWSGNLAQFASEDVTLPSFTLALGSHVFDVTVTNPNGVADDNPANDNKDITFDVSNLTIAAAFDADQTNFCSAPASVQFTNLSQNATSYLWDFGDGTTSTEAEPLHEYSALGAYTVILTADAGVCGNDVETQVQYIIVGATPPVVTDASHCGAASVTLGASGSGTLNWFDASSGGNLINTGTSYVTPVLTSTTSYYVQNEVASSPQAGGKPDNSGTGGYLTNQNQYLIFDCYAPCTLVSVEVYAETAGNRTFELRTSTGAAIQEVTVNITTAGSVFTVPLNFSIPVGTALQIGLKSTSTCSLYRNTDGITYPYTTPGYVSVTGSSAGATYYYYLYDWVIQPPTCTSSRETVTAFIDTNVPTSDFSFSTNGLDVTFTDQSLNPASYLWNFGDGTTSTDANPVHSYTADGSYVVTLIISNGCGSDTSTQNVTVSAAGIQTTQTQAALSVYPNPASRGDVVIEINGGSGEEVLSIFDLQGRKIEEFKYSVEQPKTLIRWNASKVLPGLYYIRLSTGDINLVKKLMITE
jgi:PKD repeat protein